MGKISFIQDKAVAELEGLVLTKAWEVLKSGGFQLEVGIYTLFLWGIGAKGVPNDHLQRKRIRKESDWWLSSYSRHHLGLPAKHDSGQ